MNGKKYWVATAGLGCVMVLLVMSVVAVMSLVVVPYEIHMALSAQTGGQGNAGVAGQMGPAAAPAEGSLASQQGTLMALYRQANPGVVIINVSASRGWQQMQGAGSGFVYDEQGHIVTANHVVDGADRVTVVFYDGSEEEASVVGADPNSDLAVIKVQQLPKGAHALPLGDSDRLAVGQAVVALGNPFDVGTSMTEGIISALGRTIESGVTNYSIPRAIQTDAAINHGNSGGPLLDLSGEVVGINVQMASGSDSNAGVGFAIPSNTVRQVVPVLMEKGSYEWPWLGVSGGTMSLAVSEANGLGGQKGAYIDQVVPDGPAAKAGLRGSSGSKVVNGSELPTGGDVITAVDGKAITSFDALLTEISARKPGDQVRLTILRAGKSQEITVTLGVRPARQG